MCPKMVTMAMPPETRRWALRALLIFVIVQVVAVVSLVISDRLRRVLRGQGVETLPRVRARKRVVGDENELSVHVSGATLYDHMLEAIDAARTRILLESYIIKNDETGQRFKRALMAAADRGVDVRVTYDGFANLVVKRSFFDLGPNVPVLRYPLAGSWAFWNPRTWGRDHRKILVVDDTVGFVGGYNIGKLYADEWRDTHLSIRGPALWELENAFIDFWNAHDDRFLPGPLSEQTWQPHIRAHRNVPEQLIYPIRAMYLEAIDRAQDSIEITQAYFIPDRNILDALIEASSRGVRVRIMLPKISNHVLPDFLARGYFSRLLRSGVEILRYSDHMVHAKTMTIDGQWSTIGTANIDRLSLTGNYEINVEILDEGFAELMSEVFAEDATSAQPLAYEHWRARSQISRLYERVVRPWRTLM